MATVTTGFVALDELIARLENTQSVMNDLEAGMQQAATLVRDAEAEYPEPGDYHLMGNNPPPFYSERQRRYFFYALRAGMIQVPYPRTGAYGEMWVTSVERMANGIKGIISNTSPIAMLLQGGPGRQARMFEGTWRAAADIFHSMSGEVKNVLRESAVNAIRKWILGA
jgi:hypothetical protein